MGQFALDQDYDDPAFDADMRQLRKEQLAADISPEEVAEECRDLDNDDWYFEDEI
jgi:hypothetical protein